jgi:hypothetical protein
MLLTDFKNQYCREEDSLRRVEGVYPTPEQLKRTKGEHVGTAVPANVGK